MQTMETNPYELTTGVIQRLLYEKPLFNYIDHENVNIIVFGFNLLCQRFVDLAFEVAQVSGYKLNITVVSDIKNAKEQFLIKRPAFIQFFDVDNAALDCSYGHLSFQAVEQGTNAEDIVSDILLDDAVRYAYLFIDFGNDVQNYAIASACITCSELLYHNPIINCALTNPHTICDAVNIVAKSETIQKHRDYVKLKRMALNCHLLWNNSDFIDIRKLQRKFNSEYNFSSSLSSALAIHYKLNSVGININDKDAANQFYQLDTATNAESKQRIAHLIQMEHQRWVVNMICNGWSPMQDLTQCLNGRKDKKKKLHPCLVPCDAKIVLESTWKQNNFEKWNTASAEEINQLDALDQVSVKVHRIYKKKAEEIKLKNLLPEYDIYEIHKQLSDYPDVNASFSKYVLCLHGLNSGMPNQAKLYDYYKDELTTALKSLPLSIAKLITKRIEAIETIFFPILESEKYMDYKNTDADLIKKIPFILTYRTNLHIGIPLNTETGKDFNNQILFENAASLLLINPSSVTYFCKYSLKEQLQILHALRYIINCMKTHNIRSSINLCLISDKTVSADTINKFSQLSNTIKRIDIIEHGNEDELENKLVVFIKQRRFAALEKNNSATSGLLFGFRCYKNNPYYTFDSVKRTLMCYNGCETLRYIPLKTHLKISDLFDAKGSKDSRSLPDFQQDYEFFWNLYKKSGHRSETVWKCLCNALAATNKNENVLIINFSKNSGPPITKEYFVENCYVDAFVEILEYLKKDKNTTTNMQFHSNRVYKLRITAHPHIHMAIQKILSKPYLLTNPFDLDINTNWKGVKIVFTNLIVNKLYVKTMDSEGHFTKNMIDILNKLQSNNYIVNLQKGTDDMGDYYSFCYSSHQVKAVLTTAGRILELYVYYKALENGCFDEVANSVEVVWSKENVENEFDIILTSGLRSIIIECKAQTTLKQDFYYKLFMLNKEFGINSIPVIVADTCENPKHDNSVNDIQRSRGDEIGITTIYQSDDISDIGNTLKTLLKTK